MSHTAITLCVASILLFVCPSMIVSYPFMQNALRKRRNTDSGTDDIHQSWDSLRNSIGTVLNGDMLLDTFEAAHFPHPHHLSMPFEFDEHSLFDLPDRAPNAHISPLDKPSSNPAGVEFYSTSASTSHTSIETPAGRKSYSDEMSNVTYKPATSDEASSVTKAAQELDINGDLKGAVGLNVAAIPVDTDREGQSVTVVNTYQSAPGAVNDDIIALDTQVIDTDVTPTDIESNGSSSSSSTDAITESVADMPVDISTPAASDPDQISDTTSSDVKLLLQSAMTRSAADGALPAEEKSYTAQESSPKPAISMAVINPGTTVMQNNKMLHHPHHHGHNLAMPFVKAFIALISVVVCCLIGMLIIYKISQKCLHSDADFLNTVASLNTVVGTTTN